MPAATRSLIRQPRFRGFAATNKIGSRTNLPPSRSYESLARCEWSILCPSASLAQGVRTPRRAGRTVPRLWLHPWSVSHEAADNPQHKSQQAESEPRAVNALSIEPACRQNSSQTVEIWSQNRVHIFALRRLYPSVVFSYVRKIPDASTMVALNKTAEGAGWPRCSRPGKSRGPCQ